MTVSLLRVLYPMAKSFVFSSESVGEGHPDKVADLISDSVLDACLAQDRTSRVACETMVKSNYPAIAKSEEAVFGLTLDDGEKAAVNVRVVGPKHESVSYQYLLERDGDDWRIGGVYVLRQDEKPI